jgi:hypothetical protein
MLQDLENIKKLFVEKYNEKARANKANAATAPKTAERVPKKHTHGGGSDRGAPQKGRSAKYCKWCKNANGPYRLVWATLKSIASSAILDL